MVRIEGRHGAITTGDGETVSVSKWAIDLIEDRFSSWSGVAVCNHVGFTELDSAMISLMDSAGDVWTGKITIRTEETRTSDVYLRFHGETTLFRNGEAL
jgi:hypothetical protein